MGGHHGPAGAAVLQDNVLAIKKFEQEPAPILSLTPAEHTAKDLMLSKLIAQVELNHPGVDLGGRWIEWLATPLHWATIALSFRTALVAR